MSLRLNQVLFVIYFFFGIIMLSGLQTTFWYQVFGSITPPLLWLYIIVHTILYYKQLTALFLVYSSSLIVAAFTAVPLKVLLITMLVLWAVITFVKNRIFWEGPWYFTLAVLGGSVLLQTTYLITAAILEIKSDSLYIGQRLLQVLLTTALAYPAFNLLQPVNHFFREKFYSNNEGEING